MIEHFRKLSRMFLFDEDPDHEALEAEKDQVHQESQAAWKRNADKWAAQEENYEKSSSDSEGSKQ